MKETCKRGHILAETAYHRKDGKSSFCRECVKIRKAERAAEKAAAEDAS